jgi:hypothetical protein
VRRTWPDAAPYIDAASIRKFRGTGDMTLPAMASSCRGSSFAAWDKLSSTAQNIGHGT